jgi:hypothetical protein
MIRDPSDGSVREKPETPVLQASKTAKVPDTGLRQPTRTDAQERMDRSREWLKIYQEKQNARGSDEQHSTDGDSGNDRRQAKS